MNFQVIRPNGSQMKAIVHITLARILKATLVLKGLVIEWVIVKGCNEGGSTDSETDLWQESDYQVFRKITDNANAAMLNFSSPMYPEYGLKSFIVSVPLLFQRKKEKKVSYISYLFSDLPAQFRHSIHRQVIFVIAFVVFKSHHIAFLLSSSDFNDLITFQVQKMWFYLKVQLPTNLA